MSYEDDTKTTKHPSYGMIQVNRFSGGHNTFFGSSIQHAGGIKISIHRAEHDRHLNNDWYHPDITPIAEVRMSYNQFAEMITANMNTSGTPCTIVFTEKEGSIEQADFESKRLQFENEFKKDMRDLQKRLDKLTEETEEILSRSKAPTKADKEKIKNEIASLRQEINSNLPFVQSCFNEAIDKTVTEAKGELEGFYEHKIRNLGIESLREQINIPKLENKTEEENNE